jgi:hypothetical protein
MPHTPPCCLFDKVVDSVESEENAVEMAKGAIEGLAEAANLTVDGLYERTLPILIEHLWDGNIEKKLWEKQSPRHLFFDSLVRHVGSSLHHCMESIVDIFVMHLRLKVCIYLSLCCLFFSKSAHHCDLADPP